MIMRTLLLLSVLLPCRSILAQTAPDLTRQAVEAYQAGDLTTAIGKLRQARSLSPNDSVVTLYLGLMLYQQDTESREAQQLLESVADLYLDNAEVQEKLLDSYLVLGEKTKGLKQLERLERSMKRDERLRFQTTYLLIKYGLVDVARNQIERFGPVPEPGAIPPVVKDARAGELYFLRGLIAASEEHKAEAMKYLQAADRQDFPPRDSYQMLILADALYRMQETRLAWQAYEEYLKHFPADVDARMKLGLVYSALGVLDAAQQAFEKVKAADPRYPRVYYQLGEVQFLKNQLEDAEASFKEELKNDPDCGACLAKLARISYQRGEDAEADQYLTQAKEKDPDSPETHLVSGLIATRKGFYDQAIKDFELVVARLPDFPTAHLQLSIAYSRAGQPEKAREHRDIYNRLIQAQKDAVAASIRDERKPR
jgi:tetratricopeptide (TPR) repeat protein